MSLPKRSSVVVNADVAEALAADRPAVALETSIVAHGLPRPTNLEVAEAMAAAVRGAGAEPALTAVVDGEIRLGLAPARVRELAQQGAAKASARDLARLAAMGERGATTVAATARIAHAAGVRVMATGGIGGVHRGAQATGDVSADLETMAVTPVLIVASGAKSILDLPRTLARLETLGVPVLGWRTDRFPAFYVADSGLAVPRIDDLAIVADIARRHWALGGGGILVVQAPPEPLPAPEVEAWIEVAQARAAERGIVGAALTPFLLAEMARTSGGRTVAANRALAVANAALAGRIAAGLGTR